MNPAGQPGSWFAAVSLSLTLLHSTFAAGAPAGAVVAWGDPTNLPVSSPVITFGAGWGYSLAVNRDGELVDWGNDPGTVPAGLSNLVAVAASHDHSLALQSDGTVVAWGVGDRQWEWAVPDGLSNVVAIAANGDSDGEQSLALRNDGTVVAWGTVSSAPPGLSNVVAISAGASHSLALTIPLEVTSIDSSNQNPVIHFRTFAGRQYIIEYSADPGPGGWETLPESDVTGNGRDSTVTDTNVIVPDAARFYRLVQSP